MFGWRARLGLVVPSSNSTNEPEFYRALPEGVSLHTARMPLEDVTVDELASMSETAEGPAARLRHADVDVVAYGCTTGSLVKGHEYAEHLEDDLAAAAGVPAVATALSVERALRAVDATTVTVATPYTADVNEREREFLADAGFDVSSITGHELERNTDIGALGDEDAYRQAAAAVDPDADALFVSCTNYRTFGVVEALEDDLGVPVVTSNQATLWDALGHTSVDRTEVEGLGRLFER